MKSKIASAVYSSMPGKAISRSRPMLALLPGVELLVDPVAEDPVAEVPVVEDPDVGMIEPETAPSRAAGTDNAASIVGSTLRFSRADSF
jgi:hypothetical protein